MKTLLPALAVCALLCGGMSVSINAAEEKVEIKEKKDGSWKMKIKRKGDKEWVGYHDNHTYVLRGDVDFPNLVKDEGDYTVYGTMAPDSTYITTTKITRVETK